MDSLKPLPAGAKEEVTVSDLQPPSGAVPWDPGCFVNAQAALPLPLWSPGPGSSQ